MDKRLLVKLFMIKIFIDFVTNVCLKFKNKSAINVQVIKENNTNEIFLIEINPRFATSISLTIQSGVHIPQMLVENDFTKKQFENELTMVRDYKEYFLVNDNIIYHNMELQERDCLLNNHLKNIPSSEFDNFIFKKLRDNVDKFLQEMYVYLTDKTNILEIGEYWGEYKGAKKLYPKLNIKSADIEKDLNPDFCIDITKKTQFENENFDAIICLEVLEHTRNPFNAIKEITRILKKGGVLFLSVPCNYRIHSPFPDSWRFTAHAFHVIAQDYNYDIISLKCIESTDRLLFPIHYKCIFKKTINPVQP